MAAKKASKKATKNSSLSTGQKVGIGVGLTTAAVAAAGAYFLAGAPDAKKNRKKVKGWMLKAKGDVLEALEKAEQMTETEFNTLVASVSGTYSKLQNASKADIAEFKKEMKAHWPEIVKEGKVITNAVTNVVSKSKKKAASKPRKKTTKKTAKKATKKKK